ncbi:PadR family transcriptional regulator [Bacillus songklensis]|uniref:PadR family transcriptional regulator n=1 Tax=Bacillus songklensis TaxID=1069116 RepID=A0ABV8AVK5_9BACI
MSYTTLGLSHKDFFHLVLYHALSQEPQTAATIYQSIKESFPFKVHSRSYFYTTVKNRLQEGYLSSSSEGRSQILSLTSKGKEHYEHYQKHYRDKFERVKEIIDRFVFDLTGSGQNPPVEAPLPEGYRRFFSKLVSVKDLVRYVALQEMFRHQEVIMSDVGELLEKKFGWVASNSYLYDVAHEMAKGGLIYGDWRGERRSKRYYRLTDEGVKHFKQIADSAASTTQNIQHFLQHILQLLQQ